MRRWTTNSRILRQHNLTGLSCFTRILSLQKRRLMRTRYRTVPCVSDRQRRYDELIDSLVLEFQDRIPSGSSAVV